MVLFFKDIIFFYSSGCPGAVHWHCNILLFLSSCQEILERKGTEEDVRILYTYGNRCVRRVSFYSQSHVFTSGPQIAKRTGKAYVLVLCTPSSKSYYVLQSTTVQWLFRSARRYAVLTWNLLCSVIMDVTREVVKTRCYFGVKTYCVTWFARRPSYCVKNGKMNSWIGQFSCSLSKVTEMPSYIIKIKRLMNLYCDMRTFSFADWYCASKIAQDYRSELVHILQYKLNNL